MRIKQFHLNARCDAEPPSIEPIHCNGVASRLSVVVGPQHSGKSASAGLMAHLLYGKQTNLRDGRQPLEGSVLVASRNGDFLLSRRRDGTPQGRLTITAADGQPIHGDPICSLLGGMSPRLLGQLYAVDFSKPPRFETLLAGPLAAEYSAIVTAKPKGQSNESTCRPRRLGRETVDVDRRRVDEMVARRDWLAQQIEAQLADRRSDSAALQLELAELDDRLTEHRGRAERLEQRLTEIRSNLAEVESQLRYFALEATLRGSVRIDDDASRRNLAELDDEIGRCRQVLSDQQAREAALRQELSTLHPDGAADGLASLVDSRATLTVLERLLDDLDAEVSLLARSHEPARCIAPEAHARMTPVVEMLRQQVYTMCGQLTEQQRAARRRELDLEDRHITRAQTELSAQLEHLLSRRQLLTHEQGLANRPAIALPHPPIDQYCRCETHGEFVREADAMMLGHSQRSQQEEDARAKKAELERRRSELTDELCDVQRQIADARRRWNRLQQERGGLIRGTSLDDVRRELATVEDAIQRALERREDPPLNRHAGGWRASDVLAQLTDGRLTQIRVGRDDEVTIVDRTGRTLPGSQLSAGQRDQVYLAVTLALVSAQAERDVHLPLVLDDPFVRQDAAAAAAMAGVLHEFAAAGRQTIAFTGNRDARRRFEAIGVPLFEIDQLHRREGALAIEPIPTAPETHVRVVREQLGADGPQLRVMTDGERRDDDQDVFYLTTTAPLAEFPVLGKDTAADFAALQIHTVDDLLSADPQRVAAGLDRAGVVADTVRLWQTHMTLMCFIPGASLEEAQVLAACAIETPDDLAEADLDVLARRLEQFFASSRGARFARLRHRFSRNSLSRRRHSARQRRQQWRQWSARRNRASEDRPSRRRRAEGKRQSEGTADANQRKRRELRFLLDRSCDVVDAPSIGPKTAERLAAVGIRTVSDLLNADAESTAAELDVSHITAERLAAWQHQARLAVCIPELRGYGAQLLVGCGFTEPEQIAGADVDALTRQVCKFARSKAGQRILRDGNPPAADKIAAWVEHAAHMRPLEAA